MISATREEAAHLPVGVDLVVTGMGKVAAATATATALAQRAARGSLENLVVISLGTAGALREGLSGLFTPTRVVNHDLSAEAIRALGAEVVDELVNDGAAENAEEIVLATGDVFVTDTGTRAALAQRAHLVDMEGFAVAWACEAAGVQWRMVKHVSDNADETALAWVDAVDASARVLGEWVANFLAAEQPRSA